MLRKFAFAFSAIFVCLSTVPVAAQTQEGFYGSFSAGAGVPGSLTITSPTPPAAFLFATPSTLPANAESLFGFLPPSSSSQPLPPPTPARVQADYGTAYTLSASLGYGFAFGLRLEGQFFYSNADFSGFRLGSASLAGRGSLSNTAGLFNVVYDIPIGGPLTPYVSAGVGYSSVRAFNVPLVGSGGVITFRSGTQIDPRTGQPTSGSASSSTVPSQPTAVAIGAINGEASALAYQFGGGLRYAIDSQWSINLGYRYFATPEFSIRNSLGTLSTFSAQSLNVIELGVRASF